MFFWWNLDDKPDDVVYRFSRRYWARVDGLIKFGLLATSVFLLLIGMFAFDDTCGWFGCETRISAFLDAPANEVGDTLAGIAGALAFLWLVVTVLLQGKELAAQRQELSLTRKEVAGQREATSFLAKSAEEQRSDSFVFELISTHNSIVAAMDITKADGTVLYQGRDCFRRYYRQISDVPAATKMYQGAEDLEVTLKRYERVYRDHQSDLSQYFRFTYNMMRVIEEAGEKQDSYKKLVRALFSDDELLVLFYNSLTLRGRNFVKYIESYELFDNLPLESLVSGKHKELFSSKCYGEKNL
jgi:hypothetical protein